ncbi:MAG: arginine deiminase family protein [Ignavibacteriales bacterium]|nr:arginine deiminase family protein [Ignavibacteriales bacterium]
MGKALETGETDAVRDFCLEAGWPVAGEIREPGTLEGGDLVWLDAKTAAVGHGYRTNAEGIRQFRAIVAADGCEVIEVPLPHWDGPGDVLHLMSMLSPVDAKKLLVYSRLLAVPFRNRLLDMGFELLEVPDEEYATMATNVLALAPGTCLALAGNPQDGPAHGEGRDRGPDLRGDGDLRQGRRRPDLPDPAAQAERLITKLTNRAGNSILRAENPAART